VISHLKEVSAYIESSPEKRLGALRKIRELCLECLPGYEELMLHGMPCYQKTEELAAVGFASQKHYIALYVTPQVILDHEPLLTGLNHGKCCIRYSNPDKIDFELVKKLLIATCNTPEKPD